MTIDFVMVFTIGIITGFIIDIIRNKFKSTAGVIIIDTSNEEKDQYSLVVDDLDVLHRKSHVIFKISQK